MKESWQGQTFQLHQYKAGAYGTAAKWIRLWFDFIWGDRIYYQGEPAFVGKWFYAYAFLDLQPTDKLSIKFYYYHQDLTRDNKKVYNVNLYLLRNTYHLNKYLFLRATLQYNDYQKRLLTDFLASFTLIPGTVLHLGYGSLYEGREWLNNDWVHRQNDLLHFKRSFFAKISYLWRL
jgi:hypothetical protein